MNAPLIADKLIAQSAAFVQASRERDPSAEVVALRRVLRQAIPALAHASLRNPFYDDAYNEVSKALKGVAVAELAEAAAKDAP